MYIYREMLVSWNSCHRSGETSASGCRGVNNDTPEQLFIIYLIKKSPKGNTEGLRIFAYVDRGSVMLYRLFTGERDGEK